MESRGCLRWRKLKESWAPVPGVLVGPLVASRYLLWWAGGQRP